MFAEGIAPAGDGKPVQLQPEEIHQKDADPERRHRHDDQRRGIYGLSGGVVLVHTRKITDGQRQQHREQGRHARERGRHLKAARKDLRNRLAAEDGFPEIQPQAVFHKQEKLLIDGLVDAHLGMEHGA